MSQDVVVHLMTNALDLALKVGLPLLLAGLVVGVIVSVFQSVTQIQEQTLSFIPKILAIVAVLMFLGPWMLDQIVGYAAALWRDIPGILGP